MQRWVKVLEVNDNGNTELMEAIVSNQYDVACFIIEYAYNTNRLEEVLQVINRHGETAHSLALRAENSAFLRLIERATVGDIRFCVRRSTRKIHKHISSDNFTRTSPPQTVKIMRPRSEDATAGAASTSDIEVEVDSSLDVSSSSTKKKTNFFSAQIDKIRPRVRDRNQLHFDSFQFEEAVPSREPDRNTRSMIDMQKSPTPSDGSAQLGFASSSQKRKSIAECHSDSFTFEYKKIDCSTPVVPNADKNNPQNMSPPQLQILKSQIHFTSLPSEHCEVYDGTPSSGQSWKGDPRDRVMIAHHQCEDVKGDNSVCVPPEFHGPVPMSKKQASQRTAPSTSKNASASGFIGPFIRNFRSRGNNNDARSNQYKVPEDQ